MYFKIFIKYLFRQIQHLIAAFGHAADYICDGQVLSGESLSMHNFDL